MRGNFEKVNRLTLKHEGGYVNHPKDPGGATNYGIIQRTYNRWRKKKGLPNRSVRHIEMSEVHAIYRHEYWNPVKGDNLPVGIDYTVYDASVNSGIGRGPKWTQRALGVTADGKVGTKTLKAAMNLSEDQTVAVIKKANAYRLGFLKGLRHWSSFGRGWSRRVMEVEAGSIAMVSGPHVLRDEAKASKAAARNESSGTSGSVLGAMGTTTFDIPDLVTYGIWAAVAILAIVAIKRVVAHLDRADAMNRVADLIEKMEG